MRDIPWAYKMENSTCNEFNGYSVRCNSILMKPHNI